MSTSNVYDAIVLGAGAMGSAAAYHLAKAGQRVLLLEQFELNHQKGSSYGFSRIIRYAYDHTDYIELAKTVYPMWQAIEEESGETLYTRTGGLDFGRADQASLHQIMAALTETNIPFETLTPAEAQKRFPQFCFDEDMTVLYQADTGILSASKCVTTHLNLAERYGAVLRSNTPVTKITARSNGITIQTSDGDYAAAHLIITAGSWAKSVLAQLGLDLPLKPMRCQEIYFDTTNPEIYKTDHFPAFIAHMKYAYDRMPYGIADHQNSGLKVAFHGGQLVDHPLQINYTPDQEEVERAHQFTQRYLPGATSLRSTRVCLYTMTPDEHFIIDKHPEYQHIVFGGGCSGHSFKFGTLIGKILTDLALEGKTNHKIDLFNVARFL